MHQKTHIYTLNQKSAGRLMCDREEIMKWGEGMMNGGHWRGSQVYSSAAGKDKARQDDLWWWETDDGAMEGGKWQAGGRRENETPPALLPRVHLYIKFIFISRGHGAMTTEEYIP